MSPASRPPRPHTTWSQETLFPPQVVRVDVTWFADVEMQRMQLGWTISHGVEEQTMGMEVLAWKDLSASIAPWMDQVADVISRELRALPPFP